MALYESQFETKFDSPVAAVPAKTLVIASTPRSGSHMLGHSLIETGCFGAPFEYLNPGNLARWREQLGVVGTDDVLGELMRRRTTPNGVFSIKCHWSHLDAVGGFDRLRERLPDPFFVAIRRSDLLKQAVSYAIAQQTGVWIDGQPSKGIEPTYNFAQIYACLRELIDHNARWQFALATSGCRWMEVTFEDIRENIAAAVARIATFMDVTLSERAEPAKLMTHKQSNAVNRMWARRFIEDLHASGGKGVRGIDLRHGLRKVREALVRAA